MKRATPNNNNNAARSHEGGGDNRPPKAKKPRRPRNRNKNKKQNTNTTKSDADAEHEHAPMEVDQHPPPVATMTTDPERSATDTAPKCRQQFSETTFASLTMIGSKSKRALTDILHYESMTKVQEATLPAILAGKDVVAKAKTGSGKTTAFLLPIIENLANNQSTQNQHHNKVYAVILSPTRELANQISAEFGKLATFHPNLKHQLVTMIGGTNIGKDKARLKPNTVRVIVATPGTFFVYSFLNQKLCILAIGTELI